MELKGCGTALLTPFRGGEVDYEAYRKTVARQVKGGVDFLVPLGTTAETPCLTAEEKTRLLEITAEEAGGRPLLVGAGTNSPAQTIANMRLLGEAGADAFLVVAPYYNKPGQNGLYEYFRTVAEATDKPVVLYNVPGRTGVNISAETTLRLAEIDNIIAIKEASGNYSQISEIIAHTPHGFSVLSGNDDETLSLMATGASGVISVASNIVPGMMSELVSSMLSGNLERARFLHFTLSPLFKACFVESNPVPAKAAMALLGLMENEVRLPLVPASPATSALMENVLRELGLNLE